jgi:hypothetical protein
MNMMNKFPICKRANTNNKKDEITYLKARENNVTKLKFN